MCQQNHKTLRYMRSIRNTGKEDSNRGTGSGGVGNSAKENGGSRFGSSNCTAKKGSVQIQIHSISLSLFTWYVPSIEDVRSVVLSVLRLETDSSSGRSMSSKRKNCTLVVRMKDCDCGACEGQVGGG